MFHIRSASLQGELTDLKGAGKGKSFRSRIINQKILTMSHKWKPEQKASSEDEMTAECWAVVGLS